MHYHVHTTWTVEFLSNFVLLALFIKKYILYKVVKSLLKSVHFFLQNQRNEIISMYFFYSSQNNVKSVGGTGDTNHLKDEFT